MRNLLRLILPLLMVQGCAAILWLSSWSAVSISLLRELQAQRQPPRRRARPNRGSQARIQPIDPTGDGDQSPSASDSDRDKTGNPNQTYRKRLQMPPSSGG